MFDENGNGNPYIHGNKIIQNKTCLLNKTQHMFFDSE